MTAKIGLKDVIIHAPHGFFEEEHAMGNTFSIDVEVDAEIGGAAHDDDLGQTVNYATIYYLLRAEMKKPTQLLEALAYRMAGRIADQFDNVTAVKLRLHKLNPPLGGKVGSSYVEVSVHGSLGGGARGWDSGINRPRTFEDEYVPHFDADGPFSRPGGGGSMTGAPRRPSSLPPGLDLPPVPTDDDPLPWQTEEYDEAWPFPAPSSPTRCPTKTSPSTISSCRTILRRALSPRKIWRAWKILTPGIYRIWVVSNSTLRIWICLILIRRIGGRLASGVSSKDSAYSLSITGGSIEPGHQPKDYRTKEPERIAPYRPITTTR